MKKQVLFVQGGGQGAHEWDAKLVASLAKEIGSDYELRYPAMPNETEPDYAAWRQVLIEQVASMGHGAILVGHSIGATIVIMSIADNKPEQRLAGIFLIAPPFVGEGGWQIEDFKPPKDLGEGVKDVPTYVYHSREDEVVPFAHVDLYAKVLSHAIIRRLDGRNHQFNDDLSEVARDIKRLE